MTFDDTVRLVLLDQPTPHYASFAREVLDYVPDASLFELQSAWDRYVGRSMVHRTHDLETGTRLSEPQPTLYTHVNHHKPRGVRAKTRSK